MCGSPHKNRVLNLRDDLQQGAQTTGQDKVNLMASSMRKDIQPCQVPEEDATAAEEDTTLNIGHACLPSECWLGARGTRPDGRSNAMAAQRWPLRLRRAARSRKRHCPRPSCPAETRFVAVEPQFLTQ